MNKEDYTLEEIQALNTAVEAANGILAKLWTGRGPRYFVSYIELGQEELKGDKMVVHPYQYLAEERQRP